MKIIPASWKIEPINGRAPDGVAILKEIESAGRTCYKSEWKITDDSYLAFAKKLVSSEHYSVLDHRFMTVRFITDRGVTHELVRHRLCAFSQECVAGDTKLSKQLTIKRLFDSKRKGVTLKSVAFGRVIPNWVSGVFYKGKAPVYEVKTRLGYSIKTTLAHEFMVPGSDSSFTRLEHLHAGDKVIVNGRPSLLTIPEDALRQEYVIENLSPSEIASRHHVPYRVVTRRLHKLGIFFNHKNDKDIEKYQRNHTSESVEKMRAAIKNQYKNGRSPWNRGVTEDKHPSVKKQGDGLRAHHHNNPTGEGCSTWRGGVSRSYGRRKKREIGACELCGRSGDLHMHHIDNNYRNNKDENLIEVCINCHTKLHNGWYVGIVTHPDKIISITPVGETDVYDLEMEAPFHNYVANGFIVHNSTRYCNYSNDQFGNEITVIDQRKYMDDTMYGFWRTGVKMCEQIYNRLTALKCPPQIARSVLPNSLKTEIVATADLTEWRHIFKLRTSKKAHPQMRELMVPLLAEFKRLIPVVFDDIVVEE